MFLLYALWVRLDYLCFIKFHYDGKSLGSCKPMIEQ